MSRQRGELSGSDAEPAWQEAEAVARSPGTVPDWQSALANALRKAVFPDAVGVFFCPLGSPLDASGSVAPNTEAGLARAFTKSFLPRLHSAGMESLFDVFRPHDVTAVAGAQLSIYEESFGTNRFVGLIGRMLRAHDSMVAGWIVVFTSTPAQARELEIGEPLDRVRANLEAALRGSLNAAVSLGARLPKVSADCLSARERAVARLAARGWSDVNISVQLRITEGTVGRHLHSTYRKLEISSRLELCDFFGATDGS